MKKIFIVLVLLILILLGLFFFLGGSKEGVTDFFNGENDFGSFFDIDPQSQNDFISDPNNNPIIETPTNTTFAPPVLRQVSLEPVSGFTFYATTSTSTRTSKDQEGADIIEEFLATSTAIRFQERATGHIYDVFEFIATPIKVSNITIQKVYSTLFTGNKDIFLYQTLDFSNEQVKTVYTRNFPAQIETTISSSTTQRLETKDISTVIPFFSLISETNELLYGVKRETGAEIYTSSPERTSETLIASVPFTDFMVEPINDEFALVQTKASGYSVGYSYTLDLETGALRKIIGNIPGLLIKMSPNMNNYIYSETTQTRPIVRSYDIELSADRRISLDTLPEKCAFSMVNPVEAYCFGALEYTPAAYPDDWFKGKVSNDEDLYRVNLRTGAVEVVYVFNNEDEGIFDISKLMVSEGDSLIAFQNKLDLTLWSIDLKALDNQF